MFRENVKRKHLYLGFMDVTVLRRQTGKHSANHLGTSKPWHPPRIPRYTLDDQWELRSSPSLRERWTLLSLEVRSVLLSCPAIDTDDLTRVPRQHAIATAEIQQSSCGNSMRPFWTDCVFEALCQRLQSHGSTMTQRRPRDDEPTTPSAFHMTHTQKDTHEQEKYRISKNLRLCITQLTQQGKVKARLFR